MTDLSKWLIELAKQANVKPAPDVDVTMFVMDVFPDLAALCAQQHKTLERQHDAGYPLLGTDTTQAQYERVTDALTASKAFQEKYQ